MYCCHREIVGLSFFNQLRQSMGVQGLCGLDRLLSFRAGRDLRKMFDIYADEVR